MRNFPFNKWNLKSLLLGKCIWALLAAQPATAMCTRDDDEGRLVTVKVEKIYPMACDCTTDLAG